MRVIKKHMIVWLLATFFFFEAATGYNLDPVLCMLSALSEHRRTEQKIHFKSSDAVYN